MLMLLLEYSNKYKIKMIIQMEHTKLKNEFKKMIIQAPHVFTVRYHSRGSMKLHACILLLAHMVYL
jgi:hypothetical protein